MPGVASAPVAGESPPNWTTLAVKVAGTVRVTVLLVVPVAVSVTEIIVEELAVDAGIPNGTVTVRVFGVPVVVTLVGATVIDAGVGAGVLPVTAGVNVTSLTPWKPVPLSVRMFPGVDV